jgi:hypothetical protein
LAKIRSWSAAACNSSSRSKAAFYFAKTSSFPALILSSNLIASGIELTPATGTAVADVAAGAEAAWTTTGAGDWALAATKASNTGRKKRILARVIFPVSNKSGRHE